MAIHSTTPLHLEPPLIDKGALEQYQASGQTVSATWSNRDSSLVVFPSNNVDPHRLKSTERAGQPVYFTQQYVAPRSERRTFIIDTSVIFAAVRDLSNVVEGHSAVLSQEDEVLRILKKLNTDFVNFCKECWSHCSGDTSTDEEPLQLSADHYRKLCTCMSLFCVLYVPDPGYEEAPAGDDLMDWLNEYYVEPSTEEGQRLTDMDRPWEDEYFWPFLQRVILRGLSKAATVMLDLLANHPSPHVQDLAQQLVPILAHHPRLSSFTAEREFNTALRRWTDKVKTLRIALDRVPEDVRDDGWENWWQRMSDVVGVLEGHAKVARRLGRELGVDWRELSIVWAIYIDPRIKRQDLPGIVSDILEEFPPDPTNEEDTIQSWFFLGKPKKALAEAATFDPWLSAHLAELMEALDLIDREPLDSDLSLREHHLLSYALYLQSDPELWRIAVSYLFNCGPVGSSMADQVLLHVPLRLRQGEGEALSEEERRIRKGELDGALRDVVQACARWKREGTRREICQIAARTFLSEKEYGLAISYCTSAEDWPALGRVVECVLDEYVLQGPSNFAHLISNIAPSLSAYTRTPSNSVFLYRLEFAVRFAEFHHRRLHGDLENAAQDVVGMLRGGVAPKGWWAVVLWDSVELLQNRNVMLFTTSETSLLLHTLEEICTRSAHGAGSDYLPIFARITNCSAGGKDGKKKEDEEETYRRALETLKVVRLALAKYYARCGVYGVGGR